MNKARYYNLGVLMYLFGYLVCVIAHIIGMAGHPGPAFLFTIFASAVAVLTTKTVVDKK
jgi:hypothetical protein